MLKTRYDPSDIPRGAYNEWESTKAVLVVYPK